MPFVNESAHWMAIVLSASGNITSVSGSTEQLTGYSTQELAGKPVACIFEEEAGDEIQGFLQNALEWGSWTGEMIHRVRDGGQLPGKVTVTLLGGSDNPCAGFLLLSIVGAARDVDPSGSAFNQISAHLREIAHELNNPLAIVMGFTQLILLDPRCQGKIHADLERVYSEMGRVNQIVGRLHGYAVSLKQSRNELGCLQQTK